jgi:hypothetical protein
MATDIERQITALETMTTTALCERYADLHGQPVRTRHRGYLIRKIAWRIQALAEGDLSERARRRAAELANDADVRVMPPRAADGRTIPAGVGSGTPVARGGHPDDARLPAPGTALVREYKGRQVRVVVLPDGDFEWDGAKYKTLSSVAKAITGQHINGFRFFHLEGKR